MLRPFIQALPLFVILAAGCKSGPGSTVGRAHVPDWEAEDITPAQSQPTSRGSSLAAMVAPTAPGLPENTSSSSVRISDLSTNETWVPLLRWSKTGGLPLPTRTSASGGVATFAITSSNGAFVLATGSKVAHWEGAELRLGFAPVLIDNQPYVHRLDLIKTIQPLLNSHSSWDPPHPISHSTTVVIDPGHGGQNAGTHSVASRRFEKDYTLDWARRLQTALMARGWNALLTRSNDFDLALSNRVAFADQHRADLFVSLHFNSAFPDSSQAGLETYCLTPAGMPSTVTRGFNDEASQTFPNNAFDAQNLLLALRVHEALLPANGNHDRGVRHARFLGVLRNQHCPAILIEGGYLSNPQEARQIDEPAFRQKLAEAVAIALAGKSNPGTAQPARTASAQTNAELASPP